MIVLENTAMFFLRVVTVCCMAVLATSAPTVSLFVNCSLDPASSGNGSSPSAALWSLNAARNTLRAMQPLNAPVTVYVLPGDCIPRNSTGAIDFTQPVLTLQPVDSGTADFPVTWRAYGKRGSARLLGGFIVPPAQWEARPWVINASAPGGYPAGTVATVLVLDLAAAGLGAPGPGAYGSPVSGSTLGACQQSSLELFWGARPGILARYPNLRNDTLGSFDKIVGVVNATTVTTASSRPLRWTGEQAPILGGYPAYDWAFAMVGIAAVSLNETTGGATVVVAGAPGYPFTVGARYFGVNILSELDAPGEYYVDRTAGLLYLLPVAAGISAVTEFAADAAVSGTPAAIGANESYVYSPTLPPPVGVDPATEVVLTMTADVIVTAGTSATAPLQWVSFSGLDVLYSRGIGVSMSYTQNVFFSDMDVSSHGRNCMYLTGANATSINPAFSAGKEIRY